MKDPDERERIFKAIMKAITNNQYHMAVLIQGNIPRRQWVNGYGGKKNFQVQIIARPVHIFPMAKDTGLMRIEYRWKYRSGRKAP
jgi:hypothetical protein